VSLFLLAPAFLLFWFLTAPALMAIQRIVAGTGTIAPLISQVAECYAAPTALLVRNPMVKGIHDSLADIWCDVLDAPETTP